MAEKETELVELREERDQARALVAEMQEWLDLALAALGVETVFDIPGWRKRRDSRSGPAEITREQITQAWADYDAAREHAHGRAEKAEAERDRYQLALELIAYPDSREIAILEEASEAAREALDA